MHTNVHFSVPSQYWQQYFRAYSSTYVGMWYKNKPSTHIFLWFSPSPLLLYASKRKEWFGTSSYSHSLPKINEFFPVARILFTIIYEQDNAAILLALMSFFQMDFPYSAVISKPCVLWGHAKVEANTLAIIATGNINFAFPSFQKHRGAKRDNGKMSNLSRRRYETCPGTEQARQQVNGSSLDFHSPRDCLEKSRTSPVPGPL